MSPLATSKARLKRRQIHTLMQVELTSYLLHHLLHFKEIDRIQLPRPADTSKDKDCRPSVIRSQLFAIDRNVQREPVRVELLCSQYPRLPKLRLRTDCA